MLRSSVATTLSEEGVFVVCLSVSRTEGGRRQERDRLSVAVGATTEVVRQWCEVLAVSLALWRLRDRKIGHQNSPGIQHCKRLDEWQIVLADNRLQLIIAYRPGGEGSRAVPAPKCSADPGVLGR